MAYSEGPDVKNHQACVCARNSTTPQPALVKVLPVGLLMCNMLLQLKRQQHNMDVRPSAASCGADGRLQRLQDVCVSPQLQFMHVCSLCFTSQAWLPAVAPATPRHC